VPAASVLVVALLLQGCALPSSDGGTIVVTTDERVQEVRDARAGLAAPVPAVVGEAERLVAALERVWTEEAPAAERAALAEALRTAPVEDAVAVLDAVELAGTGRDVVAAREVVTALVADTGALLGAVREELASLTSLPPHDEQLAALLEGWDARGSYSEQLAALDELAEAAEALATAAAGRTATPACVGVWDRRADAADVVAERTRELRALVRDRRGQEFDDRRDAYGADPYGVGADLGVLDARAAAACWEDASAAPGLLARLRAHVEDLEDVLDPPDLQG
jgi:hypothetical protein